MPDGRQAASVLRSRPPCRDGRGPEAGAGGLPLADQLRRQCARDRSGPGVGSDQAEGWIRRPGRTGNQAGRAGQCTGLLEGVRRENSDHRGRRRRVRHRRLRAPAGRGLGRADRHGPRGGRAQGLRPDRRRAAGRAEKERLSIHHRRRGSPQGTVTVLRLLVWRHGAGELPRTALTVGGVALGRAVYVAVATANVEIVRSFEQAVLAVAGRTTLQVFNAADSLGGFDERIIEPLSHADGVLLATPVLDLTGIWRTEGSARGIVLPILGVDLLAESSFRDYRVVESGHDTSGSESDWERYLEPDTIFVGRRLAQRHGLTLGSALEVNVGGLVRRLVVRGILEGEGPARSTFDELAVMDIAGAQLLFGRLGRLDRLDLVTDPARPVEEVRRAVHALLPPELTVKRPQQRNAQIERMTRAFRLNVSILSVVALLVGLFLVYNTVSFAVLRRRREIGILRSLGLSSAGLARLLLAEVVLVGLGGGLEGIGFGVAISHVVLQTLAATVSNLYYQSLVAPRLTWVSSEVLVQGLLMGLVVAGVGSVGRMGEARWVEPTQALAPGGYELVGTVRIATVLTRAMAAFLLAGLAALQDPVQGLPLFGYVAVFLVVLGFPLLSPLVVRSVAPCLRLVLP